MGVSKWLITTILQVGASFALFILNLAQVWKTKTPNRGAHRHSQTRSSRISGGAANTKNQPAFKVTTQRMNLVSSIILLTFSFDPSGAHNMINWILRIALMSLLESIVLITTIYLVVRLLVSTLRLHQVYTAPQLYRYEKRLCGGVLIGHLTAFCIGIATASYSLFFVFSGLTNLATVIGFGSFGLRGVYFLSTNLEEVLVETIKKLKKGTMRAKSRLRIQILRYHKNQKTLKTSFWLWSTTVSIWAIGSIMRILSFMDDRRLDDQGHQDYNILTAVVPFGYCVSILSLMYYAWTPLAKQNAAENTIHEDAHQTREQANDSTQHHQRQTSISKDEFVRTQARAKALMRYKSKHGSRVDDTSFNATIDSTSSPSIRLRYQGGGDESPIGRGGANQLLRETPRGVANPYMVSKNSFQNPFLQSAVAVGAVTREFNDAHGNDKKDVNLRNRGGGGGGGGGGGERDQKGLEGYSGDIDNNLPRVSLDRKQQQQQRGLFHAKGEILRNDDDNEGKHTTTSSSSSSVTNSNCAYSMKKKRLQHNAPLQRGGAVEVEEEEEGTVIGLEGSRGKRRITNPHYIPQQEQQHLPIAKAQDLEQNGTERPSISLKFGNARRRMMMRRNNPPRASPSMNNVNNLAMRQSIDHVEAKLYTIKGSTVSVARTSDHSSTNNDLTAAGGVTEVDVKGTEGGHNTPDRSRRAQPVPAGKLQQERRTTIVVTDGHGALTDAAAEQQRRRTMNVGEQERHTIAMTDDDGDGNGSNPLVASRDTMIVGGGGGGGGGGDYNNDEALDRKQQQGLGRGEEDPFDQLASFRKRIQTYNRVCAEIRQSESTYVESLRTVVDCFAKPFLNSVESNDSKKKGRGVVSSPAIIERRDAAMLFNNIEEILNLHESKLSQLINAPNEEIHKQFETCSSLMARVYSRYTNGYEKAIEVVRKYEANSKFHGLLEDACRKSNKSLGLMAYLIMPVQRIPRYALLFKELLKSTSEEQADQRKSIQNALRNIEEIATVINEKKRRFDNKINLCAVQAKLGRSIPRLSDGGGLLFDLHLDGRSFLFEGKTKQLKQHSHHVKNRVVVLFSDAMLWATFPAYKYKGHRLYKDMLFKRSEFAKTSSSTSVFVFEILPKNVELKKEKEDGGSSSAYQEDRIIFFEETKAARDAWVNRLLQAGVVEISQSEGLRRRQAKRRGGGQKNKRWSLRYSIFKPKKGTIILDDDDEEEEEVQVEVEDKDVNKKKDGLEAQSRANVLFGGLDQQMGVMHIKI